MLEHVKELEARGLVERRRSGEDARCVIVRLTPAGRRFIERLFPEQVAARGARRRAASPR